MSAILDSKIAPLSLKVADFAYCFGRPEPSSFSMMNEFLAEPAKPRFFSVRAIGAGAFFGGPLASFFFIGMNFRRLGNHRAANRTFVIGFAATLLLFFGYLVLPAEISEKIPRELMPILYVPLISYVAERLQGDAIKNALMNGSAKVSAWVIAGWSVVSLVATLAMILPVVLLLPPFGFHGEKQTFGPAGAYEVYVEGDITPTEVNALVDYLIKVQYFSGPNRQAIHLAKRADDFTLSLPVDRANWDKEDIHRALGNLKADMGRSVFKGKFILILVAEDRNRIYRREF